MYAKFCDTYSPNADDRRKRLDDAVKLIQWESKLLTKEQINSLKQTIESLEIDEVIMQMEYIKY